MFFIITHIQCFICALELVIVYLFPYTKIPICGYLDKNVGKKNPLKISFPVLGVFLQLISPGSLFQYGKASNVYRNRYPTSDCPAHCFLTQVEIPFTQWRIQDFIYGWACSPGGLRVWSTPPPSSWGSGSPSTEKIIFI